MSGRVLVIDDDEFIRRSLSSALTRAGFQVTAADDGEPALALMQTQEFDVIVVDYHMRSELTGADVVRQVKARCGKRVYCAVLSGDDGATRDACLAAGADDVFLKPASPRALRDRLALAVAELRGAA